MKPTPEIQWLTFAIRADATSSPTMISAAPTRFATERSMCSVASSPDGTTAHLDRARLEVVDDRRDAAGKPRHGVELRVRVRGECARLEPLLRLRANHVEAVLGEQLDRVELGIEQPRDRVRLRQRLADERERRRQPDSVAERQTLEIGERLSRANRLQRAPVVARQLPAKLVLEARLVGVERREREAEDQIGDVLGAVLRDGEQQQREAAARVVVEPAEQAEVEQREPAVRREEHVAAMRVGVVDALDGHLTHVEAEELARELRSALGRETVRGRDLLAVDELEDEHALGHVRPDHLRDDEIRIAVGERPDQLGVVGLLLEVELGSQVNLELVGERLDLHELRRLRVAVEQARRRAQQIEILLDLLDGAGSPHLDRDLAPVREQRAMDLRDRRGCERLRIDPREEIGVEVLADHRFDLLERNRRHLVDEPLELLDVNVRKQVGSRREQLPELDVRRPELFERLAKRTRALGRRGARPDDADLPQRSKEAPAPRHAGDVDGSPEPCCARTHSRKCYPRPCGLMPRAATRPPTAARSRTASPRTSP